MQNKIAVLMVGSILLAILMSLLKQGGGGNIETCHKNKLFYVANMKFNLEGTTHYGCTYLDEDGNYRSDLLILYLDTKTGKLNAEDFRKDPSIIALRVSSRKLVISATDQLNAYLARGFRQEKSTPPLVLYKKTANIKEVTRYSNKPNVPPVVMFEKEPEESSYIYYFNDPIFNYVIDCIKIYENKPGTCRTSFGLDPNTFNGSIVVSFSENILPVNIRELTHKLFEELSDDKRNN